MYAFTMIATGTVSTRPLLLYRDGLEFVEITLCGTDVVTIPGNGETFSTHVQFMAFEKVGEAVLENMREGDSVILFANVIEASTKEDESDLMFIIRSFRKLPRRVPP